MRLVFAGTPDAAVPSLRRLAASRHEIALVVTRPDAPLGRKRVLTPSAVARAAEELALPILKTARLDPPATDAILASKPDLGVIVAYGGLVREPLLSGPEHGWINLHFSLLPRWRGAAPVQHALIAGDTETGASVFRLVAELDAGGLYGQTTFTSSREPTAGEMLHDLAEHGAELLGHVVDRIETGQAHAQPQTGEPTFAPKLTLEDARVRWGDPADAVLARIRGVTPEPGAFTTIAGDRLKILAARRAASVHNLAPGEIVADSGEVLFGTGTVPIVVETVQPSGKGAMRATDWWRGLRTETPVAGS